MGVGTPATAPTTTRSAHTARYSYLPTLRNASGSANQPFLRAMWSPVAIESIISKIEEENMSQQHTISGRRPALIWLSILIVLILLVAVLIIVLFIYPNYQRQQQVEQHYQAGVAFQDVGDWDKAVEAFERVVAIDATYKDTRTRLAEVKSKQQEVLATMQAKASQATATAQAQAAATAAAATVEAKIAQVTSVAATATAQARATAQAQEAKATATAEALAQLEAHYQKGLGYINIGRWEEARAELEQVFEMDPKYRDVQTRLSEISDQLARIRTLTPAVTSTNTPVPSTYAVRMYDVDDVVTLYVNDRPVYKAKWGHYGVEPSWNSFGHKPGDSGEQDITSMLKAGINSLRFELWNEAVCCGTSVSVEVRKDNIVIFSDTFSKQDSSSGVKYNKTFTITIY